MPQYIITMILGGFFVLISLILFLWGRGEEKVYYDNISARADVREYMEHEPHRFEPGALKLGGWISLVVGIIVLVIGITLWLRG